MKKITLIIFLLTLSGASFGTIWVITSPNSTKAFTQDSITINLGDTVRFFIGSMHDAVEVAKGNWDTVSVPSGVVKLSGGFDLGKGGGYVFPPLLGEGVHYYVCTPHVDDGMKGRIFVQDLTGIKRPVFDANLFSPYPNPASEKLNLRYSLKENGHVQIRLYNITGGNAILLLSETKATGDYTDTFDLDRNRFAQGEYLVELLIGDKKSTRTIFIN